MLKKAVALAAVLSSGIIFSSSVFALSGNGQSRSGFMTPVMGGRDASRSGSMEGMLRACQAREEAIKNRSNNLVTFSANMESVFDKIAQRVSEYYTNTVVPSGKTVTNYDSSIADVAAKKALVQNALNKATDDAANFTCDSGNPKDQVKSFNQDMMAVKKALKDYRTSIKNLIVAVHSVNGSGNEATGSGRGRGGLNENER
jgi:hypothetical protein